MPAAIAIPLVTGAIGAGAQIFGAAKASGAARDAARTQSRAADRALGMMQSVYQPYTNAGGSAMTTLGRLMTPSMPYAQPMQRQDAMRFAPTPFPQPQMTQPAPLTPFQMAMMRQRRY